MKTTNGSPRGTTNAPRRKSLSETTKGSPFSGRPEEVQRRSPQGTTRRSPQGAAKRKNRPAQAGATKGDARGVFYDLFPAEQAAELAMRATLLRGLQAWLGASGITQTRAAVTLGTTQARISDIKRGRIGRFSLDLLVRLAERAGLRPEVRLAA